MKLGLIAGNGRFPFLVLDAARAQGHDVTIIAAKEETFPELNDAAKRSAKIPDVFVKWKIFGTDVILRSRNRGGLSHRE